jgi:hypothetical protein
MSVHRCLGARAEKPEHRFGEGNGNADEIGDFLGHANRSIQFQRPSAFNVLIYRRFESSDGGIHLPQALDLPVSDGRQGERGHRIERRIQFPVGWCHRALSAPPHGGGRGHQKLLNCLMVFDFIFHSSLMRSK